MVDQTTMNGRGREPAAAREMSRNLGDFLNDVQSLAELQWELLKLDLREGAARCIAPVALVAGGLVLVIISLPLILFGIMKILVIRGQMSEDVACLVTAVGAMLIAAGIGWLGIRRFKAVGRFFQRSQQELRENIRWIQQAIRKGKSVRPEEFER